MRVLYLHPIFAVGGAKALGYDPLKSQAARAFEDTRAFGRERFAEKNAIRPVYDALQIRRRESGLITAPPDVPRAIAGHPIHLVDIRSLSRRL